VQQSDICTSLLHALTQLCGTVMQIPVAMIAYIMLALLVK
jgi:hypothetical protein